MFMSVGRFAGALVCAALGWVAPLQAQDRPFVNLYKYVFSPFKVEADRLAKAQRLVDNTKDSIVLTNETKQPWKFGIIKANISAKGRQESGFLLIKVIQAGTEKFRQVATLTGDDEPFLIDQNFGTIIITPVFINKDDFYRVGYLQDVAGKRTFFDFSKGIENKLPPSFTPKSASNPKNKTEIIMEASPNGSHIFGINKDRYYR